MTRQGDNPGQGPSQVTLELLRAQLQSIADDAVQTVIRTAISPIVNEAKDCGSVILDAGGRLITGGGMGTIHWIGARRAIQATMDRYGEDIADGDIFLANDPYNGGGMHPSDVVIQKPIFHDNMCIAWTAFSAHMIDMGGMSIGSWAPNATECYQEAFRIPPVRLIRAGKDAREIWDMLRTNIRYFDLVEMDMRCLIAGANVADAGVRELVAGTGLAAVQEGMDRLIELSERELRRAILAIADGEYRSVGWAEWGERFVRVPCTLHVRGDMLHFDFAGADAQIPFFINSQPYILKTFFLQQLVAILVPDVPFNEGVLRPVELDCPLGSVVNAQPPAPMNAGHIHVAGIATETMFRCLRLALWASEGLAETAPAMGAEGYAALATNAWFGTTAEGISESWMITDGVMTGGTAFRGNDGTDFAMKSLDLPNRELSQPGTFDVETYEAWFPMMMRERHVTRGTYGAGRWRAGAALSHSFEPHGTDRLIGQMIGTRGRLPLSGEAGGDVGAVTHFSIRSADGEVRAVAMGGSDVVVEAGERFEVSSASAGGWGDPLDRASEAVLRDIVSGRLSNDDARARYGVEIVDGKVDAAATEQRRATVRLDRLSGARPALTILDGATLGTEPERPLYPGVVRKGAFAMAEASGAILARAPDHWTDGCALIEEVTGGVLIRSYLDPKTGAALLTEAVPAGEERAFATMPDHWTAAA